MTYSIYQLLDHIAFSTWTLLVGRQERHPACKKTEWWGTGMVICLEQGADLHIAQLMPLPLTVSCFSIICLTAFCPRLPRWAGTRKVKPIWILLKWQSAPCSRQITMPTPPPLLPPNQQRRSTEGCCHTNNCLKHQNHRQAKSWIMSPKNETLQLLSSMEASSP